MNDSQPEPESDTASDASPPGWRRALRWVGWIVGILLTLVLIAIIFLHTGPGQNLVRDQIVGALSERVNGEVEIESLDFALFGDIGLEGLVISNERGDDVIAVGSVDLSLDWWSLLGDEIILESIKVDGVAVHIEELEDGRTTLDGLFKPREDEAEPSTTNIRIEKLALTNSSLLVERLDGNRLDFHDLAVTAAFSRNPVEQTFDLDLQELAVAGTYSSPDGRVIRVPGISIQARASGQGKKVEATLEPFSTEFEVTSPTAEGKPMPTQLKPTDPKGDSEPMVARIALDGASFSLDGAEIDATVNKAELGPMTFDKARVSGTMPSASGLSGNQHVKLNNLQIDAAQLNAVLGRKLLASNIQVDLQLDGPPEDIVVSGTVKTRGGNLSLKGTSNMTDLAMPVYDVTLVGDDIKTENLLAASIPEIHSDLTLRIKGQGTRPDDTVLDISLDVGETTINNIPVEGLTAEVHVDRGRFEIKSLVLKLFGRELKVVGSVDTVDHTMTASVVAKARFDELLKRGHNAGLLPDPKALPVTAGSVDIDLTLSGDQQPGAGVSDGPIPPEIVARLPFGDMGLSGHVRLSDVDHERFTIGRADLGLNVQVDGAAPSGSVRLAVDDLKLGAISLARIDGLLTLDDEVLSIAVAGHRELPPNLDREPRENDSSQQGKPPSDTTDNEHPELAEDADLRILGSAHLDKNTDEVVITLEVLALKGLVDLEEPVTFRLPRGEILGEKVIPIPKTTLGLAGGTVAVQGDVTVVQGEEPGSIVLADASARLDLDGVSIHRAARLAGRRVPMRGRVSGEVFLQGPLENPTVDWDLRARARVRDPRRAARPTSSQATAESGVQPPDRTTLEPLKRTADQPVNVRVRGGFGNGRARVNVAMSGSREVGTLATVRASLPLRDGLALSKSGRMDVYVSVPERELRSLESVLPESLLALVPPDASLSVEGDLQGSLNRPKGTLQIRAGGPLLAAALPDFEGTEQLVALTADFSVEGRQSISTISARVVPVTDKAAEVTVDARLSARRSPLATGKLNPERWDIGMNLTMPALEELPLPVSEPLSGRVLVSLEASGTDTDLGPVELTLEAGDVKLGARPAVDVNGQVSYDPATNQANLGFDGHAGGLHLLSLTGGVALNDEGVIRDLRRGEADYLRDASITAELTIPDTEIRDLAVLGVNADVPGKLSGRFDVHGTFRQPALYGQVKWDGYNALDGKPGQTGVLVVANDGEVFAEVQLGGEELANLVPGAGPMELKVAVPRKGLQDFIARDREDLSIQVTSGGKTQLTRVLPAFAVESGDIEFGGEMALDLKGGVTLRRQGATELQPEEGLALTHDLSGGVEVDEGIVNWVDLPRGFERIQLRAALEDGDLVARGELHESDMQVDDRWAKLQARLELDGTSLTGATADFSFDRWLFVGSFEVPQAEFSGDLDVEADLSQADRKVNVVVNDLLVNQPNRLFRGHFMEKIGDTDVTYIESEDQVGLLGTPEMEGAPVDRTVAEAEVVREGQGSMVASAGSSAGQAELEEEPPDDEPGSTTIVVQVPNNIDVKRHPFELKATGEVVIRIDDEGTSTSGGLTAHDGAMNFMGNRWEFVQGGLEFDDRDPIGRLNLHFKRQGPLAANRELAKGSWDEAVSRLWLHGPLKKNQITLSGPGGSHFRDSASFQVAQSSQWTADADMPGGPTPRIPSSDRGLVLSFINSNLPHMHFMDRVNAWADPYDKIETTVPESYGHIDDAEVEVYFGEDDSTRLVAVGRRRDVARNRAEVQYDYLFANDTQHVAGIGARAGSRAALGFEVFWEWSSVE